MSALSVAIAGGSETPTAYASIKRGTFPVSVVQVTPHQWRVSTQALLELAGLESRSEVVKLRAVP